MIVEPFKIRSDIVEPVEELFSKIINDDRIEAKYRILSIFWNFKELNKYEIFFICTLQNIMLNRCYMFNNYIIFDIFMERMGKTGDKMFINIIKYLLSIKPLDNHSFWYKILNKIRGAVLRLEFRKIDQNKILKVVRELNKNYKVKYCLGEFSLEIKIGEIDYKFCESEKYLGIKVIEEL